MRYIQRSPRACMQPVTEHPGNQTQQIQADGLTIAAIGMIAHMLANVLHEGVGRGGACLLSGGKALVISTVHMECSAETRLVMAGGTLMNFIAGALFFALGRATA